MGEVFERSFQSGNEIDYSPRMGTDKLGEKGELYRLLDGKSCRIKVLPAGEHKIPNTKWVPIAEQGKERVYVVYAKIKDLDKHAHVSKSEINKILEHVKSVQDPAEKRKEVEGKIFATYKSRALTEHESPEKKGLESENLVKKIAKKAVSFFQKEKTTEAPIISVHPLYSPPIVNYGSQHTNEPPE